MIRRLNKNDYKAALQLVEENTTFQRKPMTFGTRVHFAAALYQNLYLENPNHYFFGDFDLDSKLLSWVTFWVWNKEDGPYFTYGVAFTSNTIPLEKVGVYSKTLIDVVDYGFEQMENLNLEEGFMLSPFDPDWKGHLKNTENKTVLKWEWAPIEIIEPFKESADPRLTKYVLVTKLATTQQIIRFTRKI